MVHAMYEHVDDYGKVHHLSAKIGGYRHEAAAIAAIVKRSAIGFVTDEKNVPLFVVRNGMQVVL